MDADPLVRCQQLDDRQRPPGQGVVEPGEDVLLAHQLRSRDNSPSAPGRPAAPAAPGGRAATGAQRHGDAPGQPPAPNPALGEGDGHR